MQVLFGGDLAAKTRKKLGRSFCSRMNHVYFIFEKHKIYLNRNLISPFLEGVPI
jgi:hypothetical protein